MNAQPAPQEVVNFGRNVRFTPRRFYQPTTEEELVEILNAHRQGRVRVVASRHSWSEAIVSEDVLIDMRNLNQVTVDERQGEKFVTVGGGCQVKRLLAVLNKQGLTTPSVGLITEQTIAGAIATGTHGSGKHSLSHYVRSLKIACFAEASSDDIKTDEPHGASLREITAGVELQAARCAVGCLGVVTEVVLPCIDQYYVLEKGTPCDTLEEVLSLEERSPLQQFYLLPHSWKYVVQERKVAPQNRRSWHAPLYRLYWFLSLDIGLHLAVKLFASLLGSRRLIHFLFRFLLPLLIFPKWEVIDRSDRMLVMEHELFRHLELEAFVRRGRLIEAANFVKHVLAAADDSNYEFPQDQRERLRAAGLEQAVEKLRGAFTHHYPICFRRILPDDTLISMAAADDALSDDAESNPEDWFAISFITYVEPRDDFFRLAGFLAESLHALFGARIHWGKWFPLGELHVRAMYPRLGEFQQVCRDYDPQRVFCNAMTRGLRLGG